MTGSHLLFELLYNAKSLENNVVTLIFANVIIFVAYKTVSLQLL